MFSENNYFPLSGNGGINGLTEDEDKFRRWQICSPDVARAVSEFEDITVLKGNEHSEFHHHEDSKVFKKSLQSMLHCLQPSLINLETLSNQRIKGTCSTWNKRRDDR